jgi:hypothetical protein
MKKRTKEQSAAYFRAYRARKKAAATVTPAQKKGATPIQRNTRTATPKPDHCANCADLAADVSRLTDRIATLEAQLAKGDRATPTADDADALRQRVISDKINSYGKNPVIGRASL